MYGEVWLIMNKKNRKTFSEMVIKHDSTWASIDEMIEWIDGLIALGVAERTNECFKKWQEAFKDIMLSKEMWQKLALRLNKELDEQ